MLAKMHTVVIIIFMTSEFTIDRYDDHQWLVHVQGSDRDFLFSVENAEGQNEYELVEAVARSLIKGNEVTVKKEIEHSDRKWKVEDRPILSGLKKVLAQSTSLVHLQGTERGLKKYTICQGSSRTAKKQEELHLEELRKQVPGATDEELKAGVRKQLPVDKRSGKFDDSFTKLACFAFEHGYERNYSAKDKLTPDDADSSLVLAGDTLQLVMGSKNSEQAVQKYRSFLEDEYGTRKVDEVQKAFKMDLSSAKRLTPEHVYRMNIGLRTIDADDLEELIQKLPLLKEIDGLSLDQVAEKTKIPKYLLRSLMEVFVSPKVSGSESDTQSSETSSGIEVISDWVERFDRLPTSLGDCTEKELELLMEPFSLDKEASEASYTGRKIKKPLQAGYTTAELGEEKLWIDRQELSQAFDVMANTQNRDLWLEKLDHVVVKANLLKGSEETGFYSSTLIPALLTDEGERRWYKVSRCTSNGFGIFTYTLEPAGKDSKLPAIFLARSTASSEYALHGKDTLLNDLNGLNPPGYEGMMLNVPYDAEFFKKYSVPIWVGHMMQAKTYIDAGNMDDAVVSLREANRAIETSFTKQCGYRGLTELARDYDWLLNRIGLEMSFSNLLSTGYLKIYKKIMHGYVDRQQSSQAAEKEDAQALVRQLKEVQKQLTDEYVLFGIDRLIGELEHNIIQGDLTARNAEVYNQFRFGSFAKLDGYRNQIFHANQIKDQEQVKELVSEWYNALYTRAKERNELPEDKVANGIIVTGQSLGGAISQNTVVRQFVDADRIPVGQLENYTISAPGIRHDDRVAFNEFAGNTAAMREAIGSSIKITHLTEAADFVFLAGEGHLGSVHKEDDAENLKGIEFYAAVREMVPGAFEYETVHATQFMEGREGIDYFVTVLTPQGLGLFEDAKHFISHNRKDSLQLEKEATLLKARFKFRTFLNEEFVNKVSKNSIHIRRHIHQQRTLAPGGKQRDGQGVFLFEKP